MLALMKKSKKYRAQIKSSVDFFCLKTNSVKNEIVCIRVES